MVQDLSYPSNDCCMMHAFDSFKGSKAHLIGVHQQAFVLNFLGVALRGIIAIDALSPAIDTDVILSTFFLPVFAALGGLAFRALHGK